MSQEELALLSDIHPAYLGRVERGEKCPTVQTLFKISQGLKVPLPQLMDIDAPLEHTNLEAIDAFLPCAGIFQARRCNSYRSARLSQICGAYH